MPGEIADISQALLRMGLASSVTDTERAVVTMALKSAAAAVRRHLQYDPTYGTRIEFYPQNDFRSLGREGIWEVTDTEAYLSIQSEAASNEIQLQNIPIRSITSLKVDYDGRSGARAGSFGDESLKTEGTDYWPNYDMVDSSGNKVCRDGIIRAIGTWPDVAGSVKIEYVSGYTDAELQGQDTKIDAFPILEAVLDEMARRVIKHYSTSKRRLAGFTGPLASESLGDYSYSADTSMLATLIGGMRDILPETEHKLADFRRLDLGVI